MKIDKRNPYWPLLTFPGDDGHSNGVTSTAEALSTLAVNMLRTDRDWEATPIDSLLYLVIVGRGEDIKERLAERHGWTADDMRAIERIRSGLRPASAHEAIVHQTSFGVRLAEARKRAGFTTIRELAARVDIAEATLCRYERDKREPRIDAIVALARACNVDPGWLITGEPGATLVSPTTEPT